MNICIPLIGFKTDTIMNAYTHRESESNGCAYTNTSVHVQCERQRTLDEATTKRGKKSYDSAFFKRTNERTFVCLLVLC